MLFFKFILVYKIPMRREVIQVHCGHLPSSVCSTPCVEMFTTFSLFLLLFGWREVVPLKLHRCPSLGNLRNGVVVCHWGKNRTSCESNPPVGSVAEFSCRDFYRLSSEGENVLKCRSNGSWSSPAPQCIPDCGKRGDSVSLVVRGTTSFPGTFPWHVAIYNLIDGNYEHWCGGSLMSETAVITAAHCAWEIPAENLMLVFGKFHRDYNITDRNSQRRRAKKIVMLSSYQDVVGNYNGDIAVIFLQEPVTLGHYSIPVCIDWDQRLTDGHLLEGSSGVVLGWGLTENDTFSDSLRVVRLPVVSDQECIADQERDFKKYITYTTFCAGLRNGTGVCNGDSGGGLTFFDEASDRWYLQGLVSVSPRRKGTPFCDLNFYTVFTKVSAFSKWLKAVERIERETSAGEGSPTKGKGEKIYAGKGKYVVGKGRGKEIGFLHTKKMLELAQLSKASQKPVPFSPNF